MIQVSTDKKINCPDFQAKEEIVLTGIISAANGDFITREEILKLEGLMDELSDILRCSNYDKNSNHCKKCREIFKMRRQRVAIKLCSIYQSDDYDHETKLTFSQFQNLPGEIA